MSGRAGRVPTAITIRSARIGSSEPSIRTVWSSSKRASPGSQPTMLRRNCSRTTAVSAAITRAVRSISCWSTMRSVSSIRVGSRTSSGRSASCSRTASRSVLDGIVPVWMETPPRRSRRSATATRLPSLAAWMAAFCPEGPEPMTSRSSSTRASCPESRPTARPGTSAAFAGVPAGVRCSVHGGGPHPPCRHPRLRPPSCRWDGGARARRAARRRSWPARGPGRATPSRRCSGCTGRGCTGRRT